MTLKELSEEKARSNLPWLAKDHYVLMQSIGYLEDAYISEIQARDEHIEKLTTIHNQLESKYEELISNYKKSLEEKDKEINYYKNMTVKLKTNLSNKKGVITRLWEKLF